jgi:hypothetical protein
MLPSVTSRHNSTTTRMVTPYTEHDDTILSANNFIKILYFNTDLVLVPAVVPGVDGMTNGET